MNKKIINKILALIIILIFAVIMIPNVVNAGSYSVSASSKSLNVGGTSTITISVSGLTGRFDITSSNSSIVSISQSSAWVENSNATITATAKAVGSATITVTPKSVADSTTGDEISAPQSITITVSAPVQQPSPSAPVNPSPAAPTFSNVNETVYATTEVNVRSSYSTSSSRVGSLQKGDSVTRTGIGSNGWSRVTYNGQTAYIMTSYLTKTKPVEEPSPTPSTKPEEEKSNDSTLKSLTITGVQLTPAFASNITSYIANIGEEVTEVEVLAEVSNEKAKYEIVGNKDLQDGENRVIITVTAEDGTVTNYEIKLIKGEEKIPLDVFKIVGIKENDEKVDIILENPALIDGIVEYTINLSEYMKSIDIQALLSSDLNQYEGLGIFDLVVGENKFTVLLKQQQGEGEEPKTTEYRITINNPEKKVEQPVVEAKEKKVNYKLIVAIASVAVITIAGITFAILYYKKQNDLEYAKPDYSFLREDEDVQNKEQKRAEEKLDEKLEENDTPDDNNDEPKRRGGKHF